MDLPDVLAGEVERPETGAGAGAPLVKSLLEPLRPTDAGTSFEGNGGFRITTSLVSSVAPRPSLSAVSSESESALGKDDSEPAIEAGTADFPSVLAVFGAFETVSLLLGAFAGAETSFDGGAVAFAPVPFDFGTLDLTDNVGPFFASKGDPVVGSFRAGL